MRGRVVSALAACELAILATTRVGNQRTLIERSANSLRVQSFVLLAAMFVVMLIWRWDYRAHPPYEDLAWLWQEAMFLAENDFDYYKLWTEEPRADQVTGAGRAYLISIVPSYLAVLMKISPTAEGVFLAYHLFYFLCGAAIFAAVYYLLAPKTGRIGALATGAAMLTTPAFTVRLEMIGMDLPMTALALLAAILVQRRSYGASAGVSFLAFLIKPTGAIITAAIAATLFLLLWFTRRERATEVRRRRITGFIASVAILALEVGIVVGTGMMQIDNRWSPPEALTGARLSSAPYWVPDVLLIFLAVFFGLVFLAVRTRASSQNAGGDESGHSSWRSRIGESLAGDAVFWMSALIVLANTAAMTRVLFMPRYLTLSIPFLFLLLGFLLLRVAWQRVPATAVLLVLTVFNLANSHGAFYIPLIELHGAEFERQNAFSPRASVALERSLEYRADLQSTIDALRKIDRKYSDRTVFADDTYVAYMMLPRFGYVSKSIRTCELDNYPVALEKFLRLTEPAADGQLPPAPLFMIGGLAGFTVQGPSAEDLIHYNDQEDIPLIIFEHPWAEGSISEADREAWYFDHLCPGEELMQSTWAIEVAQNRIQLGELARAQQTLALALERHPDDAQLWTMKADVLIRQGRVAEANECCERSVALARNNHRCWGLLATIWLSEMAVDAHASSSDASDKSDLIAEATTWLRDGDLKQAAAAAKQRLRDEPTDAIAAFILSAAALRQNDSDGARSSLERLLKIDEAHAPALFLTAVLTADDDDVQLAADQLMRIRELPPVEFHASLMLGCISLEQGRLAEAIEAFNTCVVARDASAEAHYFLGLSLLQMGEHVRATKHLQKASRLAPTWSGPADALAVLDGRNDRQAEASQDFERDRVLDESDPTGAHNASAIMSWAGIR